MDKIIEKIIEMINIRTSTGLENFTAVMILIFSLAFCYIFIIPLDILTTWPTWLIYLITYIFILILRLCLFSSDKLYYGDPSKDRYVEAFQKFLPSKHLMDKFGLTKERAEYFWFEIFNKWKAEDNPRHDQWERTLGRGYACRFAFYLIKTLIILIIMSTIGCLINLFISHKLSYDQIVFLIILIFLYGLFKITNSTNPNNLKGVWQRFDEINKNHIQWIDDHFNSENDMQTFINSLR